MISDMLNEIGILKFSAIPVKELKITKEYLLRDFSAEAYAVFVLIPYYTGRKSNLASFAAVPDYHGFAERSLGEIAAYIKEKYGKNARAFADHSPFDEVHGAAVSGLGVIGDHGLLITDAHSSFVCIAEIVCDLTKEELAAEGVTAVAAARQVMTCEHCGMCAEACPNRAIGDKSRCLAFISQKKGDFTPDEKEAMRRSAYIWGCDICQLACPHTKAAAEAGTLQTEVEYFKSGFISVMTEEYLSGMTEEDYKKYTFSWRKRDVMERNIRTKGERRD